MDLVTSLVDIERNLAYIDAAPPWRLVRRTEVMRERSLSTATSM